VEGLEALLEGTPLETRNISTIFMLLMDAAALGKHECVNILLDYNTSVPFTNEFGQTPLHVAAYYGKVSVVRLLIRRCDKIYVLDDIDAVDNEGFTAVQYAAARRNYRCMKYLKLCDARIKTKDGKYVQFITKTVLSEMYQVTRDMDMEGDLSDDDDDDDLRPC
jgi:hypothetical protein